MAKDSQGDLAAFQRQVEQLAKVAETSTDECVVAMLIASRDAQVQQLVVDKLRSYVWKGVFCRKRSDGRIAVVFDFECTPGQICLVRPWFAAAVDLDFGRVYAIQDPYRPETSHASGCTCKELRGCSSSGSASLKHVRVEDNKVKGEVWASLHASCSGIGTIIDFDGKAFDFEIDRDGGEISRDIDISCAHLKLRVYVTTNPSVCVHWDITGCKVKNPIGGGTLFEFDEHSEHCEAL